ncbi:MAG: ubiquinone/menaquinone biosynthesis methyltransferase [Terriglobales bacterium]
MTSRDADRKPMTGAPEPATPAAKIVGAAPSESADERAAAAAVRGMFTSIAPRYDLLNHLLSFNVDRIWWRRAARTFAHVLERNDAVVLDICCGTGDMAFALWRQAQRAHQLPHPSSSLRSGSGWGTRNTAISGVDFSHAMLVRARDKSAERNLRWIEADALQLPFEDGRFRLVTSAFGFRNLANYNAGLREIYRVLAPGGEIGILDFGEPSGWIGKLYRVYFRRVLPAIGTLISGVRGPYAYLPQSVQRFPAPEQMLDRMRAAGFHDVSWTPYTFGIAGLYRGTK